MGSGKPEFTSNNFFVQSGVMPTGESKLPQIERDRKHLSHLQPESEDSSLPRQGTLS